MTFELTLGQIPIVKHVDFRSLRLLILYVGPGWILSHDLLDLVAPETDAEEAEHDLDDFRFRARVFVSSVDATNWDCIEEAAASSLDFPLEPSLVSLMIELEHDIFLFVGRALLAGFRFRAGVLVGSIDVSTWYYLEEAAASTLDLALEPSLVVSFMIELKVKCDLFLFAEKRATFVD